MTLPTLPKKCPYSEYSGQYFPAFGLNTKRYGISLRMQCECWKMRSRINPNTDTFHAVQSILISSKQQL